jgi:hypothetical protein
MYIVLSMLIVFPLGATIVGAFYLRMYLKVKASPSLVTGSLWVIYSIYEFLIYERILCTGECNIRVDFLIIYPMLLVFSLIASGLYFYKKKKLSAAK